MTHILMIMSREGAGKEKGERWMGGGGEGLMMTQIELRMRQEAF